MDFVKKINFRLLLCNELELRKEIEYNLDKDLYNNIWKNTGDV